jgi:hypothetical protein
LGVAIESGAPHLEDRQHREAQMSWSSGVARQHVSYFSKLAARRVDAIGNVGNGIIVFRGFSGVQTWVCGFNCPPKSGTGQPALMTGTSRPSFGRSGALDPHSWAAPYTGTSWRSYPGSIRKPAPPPRRLFPSTRIQTVEPSHKFHRKHPRPLIFESAFEKVQPRKWPGFTRVGAAHIRIPR